MRSPHSFLRALAIVSTFALATHVRAADEAVTAEGMWGTPAKGVEFTGIKYIKESKKIVLPTLYVRMMDWGKVTAVTQTSALQSMAGRRDSTVRDTKEIVASVPPDLVRAVGLELYTDLADKLKTAGYEIITYDQAKQNAILAALPEEKVDEKTGAVMATVNYGKSKFRYLWVAPPGMPVYDPPIQGPLWPMRNAIKEMQAHAMIVTYTFDPVILTAESSRGVASISANAKATAQLRLTAYASFLNPKGAGGAVQTKEPRRITDDVGSIVPVANVSPNTANALSKGLSTLFGGGSITSRKNLLALEADHDRLRTFMIAGGKAFNDLLVRSLAEQTAK